MVRKKKEISTATDLNDEIHKMMTADAFQNAFARTGYATPNLMEGTNYPLTRLTRDYALMNALYRNNWLAQRVISIIPKDMLKNGWNYETELDPQDVDRLVKYERRSCLKAQLLQGLNWGRLYGGAAGLMLIDGQEDMLDQPLDVDSIMPGDFKGLMIVDRWAGIYPDLELITDINSPERGLPKFYQFRDMSTRKNYNVHHSRIIRFIGHMLPEWEREAEVYWGSSVIEPLFEELKKRDNTSANIALLIFQARLTILKLKNLDVLLAGTNVKAKQDFYNTVQAQNWLRSSQGMQVIGADDTFESVQYTFAGLNEIYESFMLDMSGAAQIPVTKLFGRAPAGMNATGESDMRNYYDVVEQEQESALRPALEKIMPVLCMSALGAIPDDIEIVFNPIQTPEEKDVADLVKAKAEAVMIFHNAGIISDQTALKEAKIMGTGTAMFSSISDEDINAASTDTGMLEPEPSFGFEKEDDKETPPQ